MKSSASHSQNHSIIGVGRHHKTKMVDQEEIQIVEAFLKRMQESLEREVVAGRHAPRASLVFASDKFSWGLDAHDSYAVKSWKTGDTPLCEGECTLTASLPTLCSIATGQLRPMQAFLSGKLQFKGDRHVLREYGDAIRVSIDENSVRLDSRSLSVQVVNAVTERIQGSDKSRRSRSEDINDMVVKYVLQVTDSTRNQTWTVRRRFSEFVKLRTALVQQGFSLPTLKGRNRFFYSQETIVSYRIAHLDGFLAQLLQRVPASNFLVSTFLMRDSRSLFSQRELSNGEGDGSTFNQAIEDIRTHLQSLSPRSETANEVIAGTMEGRTVPSITQALRRNAFLCFEFASLRNRISTLEGQHTIVSGDMGGGGGPLSRALLQLHRLLLVAFAAYLFIWSAAPHEPNWHFAISHLLLACLTVYIAVTSSARLFLAISVAVTAAYGAILCMTSPSLSTAVHTLLLPLHQWIESIAAVFLNFSTSTQSVLALSAHCLAGALCVLLSRRRRLLRSLFIATVGLSLIIFYFILPRICRVIHLDDQTQERLFSQLDLVVSAFIADQLRALKSIFIKFAQYLGARGDLFSPTWCKALSKLQDNCSYSSFAFVRSLVEQELNEVVQGPNGEAVTLEDVFTDFSTEPIASASIAQVHFATLDLRKVRKLSPSVQARESQREDSIEAYRLERAEKEERETGWSALLRKMEEVSAAHHTNPIFSAHAPARNFMENHFAYTDAGNMHTESTGEDANATRTSRDLISVAVKVQHEDIAEIMESDMQTVVRLVRLAANLDSRWTTLLDLLDIWRNNMLQELDFQHEAFNLQVSTLLPYD